MPAYRRLTGWVAAVLCVFLSTVTLGEPHYTDHRRVLYFLDDQGREQPVKTAEDWAKRREHILRGMQQAMGTLPDRSKLPPLDVKVHEQFKRDEYTRMTISFASEIIDGKEDRVPAYLYLPRGDRAGSGNADDNRPGKPKRLPAMLAVHQTHPLGKGDVDFEKGRTNRCYASELAARGYVVLAPDYPSFGDYKFDFQAAFKSGRYASGTMKGIFNHMRCIDLLQARDDVDGERIGAIGHSLGGHNAIFLAAFDTRVKVVISSCGWTPFHDYYGGKIAGWTSDRYMPRLRDVYKLDADQVPFDFYELVAALAPRSFFSNSPLRDSNFDVAGVKKAEATAREVFKLLKADDKLVIEYPDDAHDFPPSVRQSAYRFVDKALARERK